MDEQPVQARVGMVGRIPVRNLWLLMLYASQLFLVQDGKAAVQVEDIPDDIPDLVAELLALTVEQRLRQHLSFGYAIREAPLTRVRGKIDVLTTERRRLLSRGLVACHFEELTTDTPRNRFVRAALESISRLIKGKILQHRCRALALTLKGLGVTGLPPTRSEIELIRFGRHDSADQTMIVAAKLAFDLSLPTEDAGNSPLPRPVREEKWVRRLFEKAVGGFFRRYLVPKGWRVLCGETLQWPIEWKSSGIDPIFPLMKTDVVLEKIEEGKRIVIDTKFNEIVSGGWFRKETLRSGYIYQMYAYLRSQEGRDGTLFDTAEGVLLHPSIGEQVDKSVIIQGHRLRFVTVDLSASASCIQGQLLGLFE